ncbi:dTDP-4-dehydrorhamnose 3,5-epimerase, partial [Brachyspira hampsonii]|nr:dTDP-4-dehydrorhamnose 3,5-epimerase [Brachyspira hampsonii]
RWDDPAFNIKWPECENRIMSEKDKNIPDFIF